MSMLTVKVEFLKATAPLSALRGQFLNQAERCGRCSVHNKLKCSWLIVLPAHTNEEPTDSTVLLMMIFEMCVRKLTLSRAVTVETCSGSRNNFHVLKKKEQRHELPNGDAEKLFKLGLSVFISLDCGRQHSIAVPGNTITCERPRLSWK
jgi:hypothetical protein